ALLDELGVREHAGLMLARPAPSLDFSGFITRVWDLAELGQRYRAFVHEYGPYLTDTVQDDTVQDDSDDRQALLLRTRLIHDFRQFPSLDPELPEDLVPAPQHRPEAVGLFHDLYAALAPPAQRYFDEMTAHG
ncbi:MAG: PaaX family transcriptional regulator C-terminal domain-containing protein, partial [Acidimicrobiales bacterium]